MNVMQRVSIRVPIRRRSTPLVVSVVSALVIACSGEAPPADEKPDPGATGGQGGEGGGGGEPSTIDVLADDEARTAMGIPVLVDVLDNDDTDGNQLSVATDAQHGTVVVRNGSLEYLPDEGFSGQDVFEYTVTRPGASDTARVDVDVLPHPGTVVHGRLFLAEVSEDISWTAINNAGDRLGEFDERGDDAGAMVVEWADGEREIVGAPGPADALLSRGIADDGTVLAQYLHATRYQFIGFTWKDGNFDRICDLGDGLGDCTPEAMTAEGTIVGNTYDYALYTGFVWPAGGERQALELDGYASTYAYDVTDEGVVVGVGDDSADGYSGPSRCFAGAPGSLQELPFEGEAHFVSCRAINAKGWIAGGVKPLADAEGVPRSLSDRMRAALWIPDEGFSFVPFPVKRPSPSAWRVELILGMNDTGTMVGYFQDASEVPGEGDEPETERVTRGITLTPVETLPGNSYANSEFDHVNGPI